MAIFNSYVKLPEGNPQMIQLQFWWCWHPTKPPACPWRPYRAIPQVEATSAEVANGCWSHQKYGQALILTTPYLYKPLAHIILYNFGVDGA